MKVITFYYENSSYVNKFYIMGCISLYHGTIDNVLFFGLLYFQIINVSHQIITGYFENICYCTKFISYVWHEIDMSQT